MFERCLYFNTNALVRKLNAHWEKAFSEYHLSPPHGYLLRLVLQSPGLTQQKIAQELMLEKSTVTRFVNVLEKKGLVIRKIVNEDQREKSVFPTKKALVLQEKLEQLGGGLYSSMCEKLGQKRVEECVTMLRTFSEEFDKGV